VVSSINNPPGAGVKQQPHKLASFNTDSTYKMQFIAGNVRYAYGFSLKQMLVSDEYLYYFPNGRQTKIFERTGEQFSGGSKFRGQFTACREVLKPNRLLLSCAANFSTVQVVQDVYNFFASDLVIYGLASQTNWLNYSLHQMYDKPEMRRAVINFLAGLGTGIRDIEISIAHKKMQSDDLPPFLSDEFKAMLLQQEVDDIKASVVYDNFVTDLLREESTGIKKLFGLLGPIIDIIVNGKVLLCDELESSLHESLLYGLVKWFADIQTDKSPQMIFTTHETGLLNLDLFRRDQIWFTEMRQEDRSTDLYSLAEVKQVRKEENFEKGYIAGRYGAIPMLNLDFAHVIAQMQKG
ncbi:MAG: AAA family ATPase, partial [Selenomonadaceae bacterium]|nr:AAA family ATPase [Selenomonadaceae bacterium]